MSIQWERIRDGRAGGHEIFTGWDSGEWPDADGKPREEIHTMTECPACIGVPLPVHLEITNGQAIVFEQDFDDLTTAHDFFAWWMCQTNLPRGAGITRKAGAVDQWRSDNPLPVQRLTEAQAQLIASRLGRKVAA